MAWYHYSTVTWISICLIFSICLLIPLLWQLICHKSTNKIKLLYRSITIISAIFCTLCIAADLVHVTYTFIDGGTLISHNYDIVLVPANVFYYIGTITLYILLVSRLFFTFLDTVYSLSKLLLIFISSMIIISSLCGIYYCIIIGSIHDEFKVVAYNRPATIILEINDFILNTTLLILFIYKLKKLITDIHEYDDHYLLMNENDNNSLQSVQSLNPPSLSSRSTTKSNAMIINFNINLDKRQNKLITIVTRHTLLGSLAIIANQLFWIGYVYDVYIIQDVTINLYPAIAYALRSLENLINIMVLYLSLSLNDKQYKKFCKHYHKACYACNIKQTKRRITKSITLSQWTSL